MFRTHRPARRMSRQMMDGHHHHHHHHAGAPDDHDSEDGQLRSPPVAKRRRNYHRRSPIDDSRTLHQQHHPSTHSNHHHQQVGGGGGSGGGHDSHDDNDDDEDTADSLDIKPPQAAAGAGRPSGSSSNHRYKEKKSSSARGERKHSSKEHRNKSSRDGGGGLIDRGRTGVPSDREHRDRRHTDNPMISSHRRVAEHRSDRHAHQQQHNAIRSGSGRAISPERYEMNTRNAAIDREHYRSGMYKERERVEKRPTKIDHERERMSVRNPSPDKSDAERALEDLRSRLLIKRSKYDAEKQQRVSETSHDEVEYRSERDNFNRYDQVSSKRMEKERDQGYRERSKKNVIEVIDSPEAYGEIVFADRIKDRRERHIDVQQVIEDPELLARRAKLLDAEREMARRKELARDELEARRIVRRERQVDNATSPHTSPVPQKRKKHSDDDRDAKVDSSPGDGGLVHVSDEHSDEEDQSGTDDSEDSSSHSDNDTDEENDGQSEGELPVSPLSVGELSKSERRRRSRSTSIERSRSVLSKSPRSRSRSYSPSRSRSSSRSRSRTRSPPSDRQRKRSPSSDYEEPEEKKPTEPTAEELAAEEAAAEAAAEALLPSYFPGVQGCRSVEEFQCLNRIEEGTYGVVYRARDKRTEEIVALKRLKMEKEKDGFPITSLREINTLLKGQHPNIVTVREIVVGSNMDKIFIVMDYVEHDLKSLMETMRNRKKSFLPGEVKCLTQQLLRAVGHLHDNWILHRDLKTSNLLLSHRGILKVGDFGLAREYGSPLKPYTSIVVTLWYRAPELLLCCTEYSHPIDMWSVGCIFAEFLAMGALFPGKSEVDQLSRIFKDLGTPNEKIWPGYNELPAVQKMTFTDYPVSNLRRKFAHLTSESGLGLLQGLLTYDPKQRLSAEQGLRHPYFKEQPLAIDPAMFPTWPAKSELGARKALASSPKPPSGGGQFKQLVETEENHGFVLNAMSGGSNSSSVPMGPGFSLKF